MKLFTLLVVLGFALVRAEKGDLDDSTPIDGSSKPEEDPEAEALRLEIAMI